MDKISATLDSYRQLLGEVDGWFSACLDAAGPRLACRAGCSSCCRALFDITLLDAWLVKSAFNSLAGDVCEQVLARCRPREAELVSRWPGLSPPYLLNQLPEQEWTCMPEQDQTPCPLLDEQGFCLVYASRPLVCRLHGLPNIDLSGEDFEGTVCTLHPGTPQELPDAVLFWRFREVFGREVTLFREFAFRLTGRQWQELDTFIPLALLADYSAVDWLAIEP